MIACVAKSRRVIGHLAEQARRVIGRDVNTLATFAGVFLLDQVVCSLAPWTFYFFYTILHKSIDRTPRDVASVILVPSCDAARVLDGALAVGDPRRITVSGAPGAVADAVRIIEDIIRETEIKGGGGGGGGGARMGGGGGGGGGGNHLEIPVMVPPEMIGRVIGRGRALQVHPTLTPVDPRLTPL